MNFKNPTPLSRLLAAQFHNVAHANGPAPAGAPGLTLTGTADSDALIGGVDDDVISGLAGIDYLSGGEGNDTLSGGDDSDLIQGDAGNDQLNGGNGDDVLSGGAGTDTLDGGAGRDEITFADAQHGVTVDLSTGHIIDDGFGNPETVTSIEVVTGSAFNDVIALSNNGDATYGGGGNDVAVGGNGNDQLYGEDGDDQLAGASGNDTVRGNDGNDSLQGGLGDDVISGGAGVDTIDGGEGHDLIDFDSDTIGVIINLKTGIISNDGYGNAETVTGVESVNAGPNGNDQITLSDIAGSAKGFDGDDLLVGGNGNDTFFGGAGVDTVDGGAGSDWVGFYDDTSGVQVNLKTGVILNDGSGNVESISNVENVLGTSLVDQIILSDVAGSAFGFAGDDMLKGGIGADTLSGGDGQDTLSGGNGVDVIDGGAGSDTVTFAGSKNGVIINLKTGVVTDDGFGNAETIVNVESVIGSNNGDDLITLAGAYPFFGEAQGLGGNDTLIAGDSFYTLDGGDGNDSLVGGALNDFMIGGNGNDSLIGGGGDDILRPDDGVDFIDGGAGIDEISFYGEGTKGVIINLKTGVISNDGFGNAETIANVESVSLNGNSSADGHITLSDVSGKAMGSFGNDTVIGGAGNDTIDGWSGNDSLTGGAGNDMVDGGAGIDVIDGGTGSDTVLFSLANSGININLKTGVVSNDGYGNAETIVNVESVMGTSMSDQITLSDVAGSAYGFDGTDVLQGGNGNDTLNGGAGDDFLVGGNGVDVIDGGDGIDGVAFFLATKAVIINLKTGVVTDDGFGNTETIVNVEGVAGTFLGSDQITLSDIGASASGFGGNDTLTGGAGNDYLDGGEGNDSMVGGAGDDEISGGAGVDSSDGGAGDDRLSFYVLNAGDVVANLKTGLVSNDGFGNAETIVNFENVVGSLKGNNQLTLSDISGTATGFAGNDTLVGGLGNDTLNGGDGADVINGGAGADSMRGDNGADTYYVDNILDTVLELTDDATLGGIDLVISSLADYTLSKNVENGSIAIGGSANLTGNELDNMLSGGSGNNILNGGAGIDTADYSNSKAAVTAELWRGTASNDGLGGSDTLQSIENLIGGSFNDLLAGTEAANTLAGMNGNDSLFAGGGNDTLLGGLGNDLLAGGAGVDSIDGGAGIDTADYASATGAVTAELWRGTASKDGQGSNDVLLGIENLNGGGFNDLLSGDEGANVINAQAGDDLVFGGGGADTLAGGVGNDLLAGNAGVDSIDGGAGIDTVDYGSATVGVVAELWRGTASNDGQGGNDVLLNIENLNGGGFNDFLVGNEGANVLNAQAGNDTMFGGGGNDTLFGGAGIDLLSGGAGNDSIDGGAGVDLADYGSATGAVTAELWRGTASNDGQGGNDVLLGIENLAGGAFNDLLAGDEGANTLYGQGGNDNLYGGGGNDTVFGGAGNDFIAGGAGVDNINGGDGIDTADYSSATSAVTAEIWRGTAANDGQGGSDVLALVENLVGGNFNDLLVGDEGVNLLNGGAGNDTLWGGGGDDSFIGGAGVDRFEGGAGSDTVTYAGAGAAVTAELWRGTASNDGQGSNDLFNQVENLTGSNFNDLLAGDEGANSLNGGAGNDNIYAGGGADIVNGGSGNDNLFGNGGADTFRFDTALNASTNLDNVGDFLVVDDTISLSSSIFSAIAPGTLGAGSLRAGAGVTTAADADDFILYNSTTGALYYDADGSGAGAAVQFAVLPVGLVLTNADFVVA